ncbi:MAG: hypothetical protein U0791_06645 [Gemmataceae bacterium]
MLAELVRPRSGERPAAATDSAYAIRARLAALRDDLLALRREKRSRWREPALFFFHRSRQVELEAARPHANPNDPLRERIAREVSALSASPAARHAARSVPGLREALAPVPAAKPLADLLAVPDDEIVLVLQPARRAGYRFSVRGVATVHQFQVLMQVALGEPTPSRFASACREAEPRIPAGVPMVVNLTHQCFRPAALRTDGTLPEGFDGCERWLWGWEPLAAAPRIDGERVILLGEPAFPQAWEVERAFSAMAASAELESALSPFQVAERLSLFAGAKVPVQTAQLRHSALAAAA